jgi:hypothetical protein
MQFQAVGDAPVIETFVPNPAAALIAPSFYPFMEDVIDRSRDRIAQVIAQAESRRGERVRPAPRQIWLYWGQGWQTAPAICHLCAESWLRNNAEYEVRQIDQGSVPGIWDDLTWDVEKLHPRLKANMFRLRLLQQHGGVWADATIYCSRPLEEWISFCSCDSRLFLFAFRPGGDRPISNWFIKGDAASPLLAIWSLLYEAYLERIVAMNRRIHAYFVQHYIFDIARQITAQTRAEWDRMPKLPPGEAGGGVGRLLEAPPPPAAAEDEAVERSVARVRRLLTEIPIHKLSWKGAASQQHRRNVAIIDELRARIAARSIEPGHRDSGVA